MSQAHGTARALVFYVLLAVAVMCVHGDVDIIPIGSVWRYDDSGVDRSTTYFKVDFDDSGWASGKGGWLGRMAARPCVLACQAEQAVQLGWGTRTRTRCRGSDCYGCCPLGGVAYLVHDWN